MNESELDATHAEYRQILAALFRSHTVVVMAEISQRRTCFALSWAKSRGWVERAPDHGPFEHRLTLVGRAMILGEATI